MNRATSLTTPAFSEDDATALRAAKAAYSSAEGAGTAPELRRYLDYYGFSSLHRGRPELTHTLRFHHWHGYSIAAHCWQQAGARGTITVVHGLFDHLGLYLPLIEHLLDDGFNVVGFDLPGHGLSSGTRASIQDFADYRQVLAACIEWGATVSHGPYHLVGQSTGCSAILYLLLCADSASCHVRSSVLLAPLVRASAWGRVSMAHALLSWILAKVPRQFGANSHDKRFLHFLARQDPMQARHIDVHWVGAMRAWVKAFLAAPTAQHRLLVIQGTGDSTVDWRWNLPMIRRKFPAARVHYVDGAMHHLVNEADPWRAEAFTALSSFLSE